MSDHISAERVISEVRRIAAIGPDYVYPADNGCRYFPDEQQPVQCLIGRAFSQVGITDEHLHKWYKSSVVSLVWEQLLTYGIVSEAMPAQMNWLAFVQSEQDCNVPWGKAVIEADKLYGEQ